MPAIAFAVTLRATRTQISTSVSKDSALSFLAVGAVLLLAGFFYQRLTTETRAAT